MKLLFEPVGLLTINRTHSWGRVNSEFQFTFFAIVNRKSLHEQRCEPWSSATAKWVEHEETLLTYQHNGKRSTRHKICLKYTNQLYIYLMTTKTLDTY